MRKIACIFLGLILISYVLWYKQNAGHRKTQYKLRVQACQHFKGMLANTWNMPLEDKFTWIDTGLLLGKMKTNIYGDGNDFLCVYQRHIDGELVGGLNIIIRQADTTNFSVDCMAHNACWLHDVTKYCMFSAFVDREGREDDREYNINIRKGCGIN